MLGGVIDQVVNGSSARKECEDGSIRVNTWPVSNDIGNIVVGSLNSLVKCLDSSREVCYIISNSGNVGINVRNRVCD